MLSAEVTRSRIKPCTTNTNRVVSLAFNVQLGYKSTINEQQDGRHVILIYRSGQLECERVQDAGTKLKNDVDKSVKDLS